MVFDSCDKTIKWVHHLKFSEPLPKKLVENGDGVLLKSVKFNMASEGNFFFSFFNALSIKVPRT